MPHEEKQFDTLPPAIVDALREIDGPAVLPDAERDADVLSGARRHLAANRPVRKKRNLRLFFAGTAGGALAAAAVLGVAFILNGPSYEQNDAGMEMALDNAEPTTAQESLVDGLPGDLDRSGSIDILDAYALARRIERGQATPTHDLNADGQTDQGDIDWIANRAVALHSGEQG